MRFVTSLALGIALLVIAPYLAHRLRRLRADERPFAAARLVPPARPRARRRSRLEDRGLFALRAFAVVALALLGASPLVRCSRLALDREGGASVALAVVVDDSLSMRAKVNEGKPGGPLVPGSISRFDRARAAAHDLLLSAREGDAVAIVLAGAPARVALAATTDLGAAAAAVEALRPSDRATDLEGALGMAAALIDELPHVDKRVVLLSDLADGHPDGAPLGQGFALPLWAPLPELRAAQADCATVKADATAGHVRVELACTPGASTRDRELRLRSGADIVARVALHGESEATLSTTKETSAAEGAPGRPMVAELSGGDAIAEDDAAEVVAEAAGPVVAVVADTADEAVATGGAPLVEQALSALGSDAAIRALPGLPDREEDLRPFVGVVVDDPPGFTPEQRKALAAFLERGGATLFALGPRAAAAPLGASFAPVLSAGGAAGGGAIGWGPSPTPRAASVAASSFLADVAPGLGDLGAPRRAQLAPDDQRALETLLAFDDGAPLLLRRSLGRGEAWVSMLPFSVGTSDLALRPGFLALLDDWLTAARRHAAPVRTEVGGGWLFEGAAEVSLSGPEGAVPLVRDGAVLRASPPRIGAYHARLDGRPELRVAAVSPREIDLRPRGAVAAALQASAGAERARVDVSRPLALLLLGLMALELAVRLRRNLVDAASVERRAPLT